MKSHITSIIYNFILRVVPPMMIYDFLDQEKYVFSPYKTKFRELGRRKWSKTGFPLLRIYRFAGQLS